MSIINELATKIAEDYKNRLEIDNPIEINLNAIKTEETDRWLSKIDPSGDMNLEITIALLESSNESLRELRLKTDVNDLARNAKYNCVISLNQRLKIELLAVSSGLAAQSV